MYTVTPITIGVQHTTYSVGEIDGTQAVCIEVISGDTAGREIVINYSTTDGSASCKQLQYVCNTE